ncbi:MAG TPA: hypothetical protein VKK61_05945 [Tepidisphaeraceae bacterium]|nr:hypothetical protein [Tepidisphaeraceae bacterium]
MLRSILIAILLLVPATIRADDLPAPASGPKTIEAPPRIMIFPFTPIGDVGKYDWIGQGIGQSLLVQTNQIWSMPAPAPTTQPAGPIDPVAQARDAGAGIVVFGSFQISGDEVRVTGQIVHVASGKVIVSLNTTGAVRDLFQLEDTLGSQMRNVLQPLQSDVAVAPPVSQPDDQDYTIHYPSPAQEYPPPDYSTDYSYAPPFYYPPIYSGFIFLNNRPFFFHHDHDHFNHDGRFDHSPFFHDGGFPRGTPNFSRPMPGGFRPIPGTAGRPFMGAGGRTFGGFNGGMRGGMSGGHR